MSEVLDWEAGGRIEPKHLDRIFSREEQNGGGKVMVIMKRVSYGIHFVCCVQSADCSLSSLRVI